jgi:succinoglycan biosynthesis protein ExoO
MSVQPVLFSVVIPVHNKEPHVERAMRSVLSQTFAPFEIILIDDASTDASIEKLKNLATENTVFLKRDEPGPGGYAARNLGIEHATGNWIAFLDADDEWLPDHLEKLKEVIQIGKGKYGCAFSGYQFHEPNGKKVDDWLTKGQKAKSKTGIITYEEKGAVKLWAETGQCPIWTGTVAIRKDVFEKAGLFPANRCRRGGDKDLWLRVLMQTDSVFTNAITAIYYRDSVNMVTRNIKLNQKHCIQHSIEEALVNANTEDAHFLRKINNWEIYKYAMQNWRSGNRVKSENIKGYIKNVYPEKYALLLLTTLFALPAPVWEGIRKRRRR